MSWAYGLIEEEYKDSDNIDQKRLVLTEIYFNKDNEPIRIADLDWEQITEPDDLKLVVSDLKGQLGNINKYKFRFKDICKQK